MRRPSNDDDPAGLFVQVPPNMTVAPDGRADVAWWDFQNRQRQLRQTDVYMTSSSDNGTTWTKNLRVTDQSVNRRIGPGLGIAPEAEFAAGGAGTRQTNPISRKQSVPATCKAGSA